MEKRIRPVFVSTFILGLLASETPAGTWIVATDGTGQFSDIQKALDAAQDGDVVRVYPGSYAPFALSKAVMIVGEGAEVSLIEGDQECTIADVGGGIAGISRLGLASALRIDGNEARVLVQECVGQSLEIANCSSVLISNWTGARGRAKDVGSLWILESDFQGLDGLAAIPGPHGSWAQSPTAGGDAFAARASSLFVSNSQFAGGKGGDGICAPAPVTLPGKLGGAGLRLANDAAAWIAQSTFTGGSGGSGQSAVNGCASADPGLGLKTGEQTKLSWDEKGDALFPLQILNTSGGVVTMEFSGFPGDQILFILSIKPQTPEIELLPDVGGFPLAVDLGSGQVNYWLLDRTILDDGKLLWKHLLPLDPSLVGIPIFTQAFLYASPQAPPHLPVLSAPAYWVIAEK